MFYECFALIWSTATLFLSGPVLVEISKRGDSLYQRDVVPMLHVYYCNYETECYPVSHGCIDAVMTTEEVDQDLVQIASSHFCDGDRLHAICPANTSNTTGRITLPKGVSAQELVSGQKTDDSTVMPYFLFLISPQLGAITAMSIYVSQDALIGFVTASPSLNGDPNLDMTLEFHSYAQWLFEDDMLSIASAGNSTLSFASKQNFSLARVPAEFPRSGYCANNVTYICSCPENKALSQDGQHEQENPKLVSEETIHAYFTSVVLVVFLLIAMNNATADAAEKKEEVLRNKIAACEDAQKQFSEWYRHMDFEARQRKRALRQVKLKLRSVIAKKNALTRKTRTGWTAVYKNCFLVAKNKKLLKVILTRLQGKLKVAMDEKANLEQQQSKIVGSCIVLKEFEAAKMAKAEAEIALKEAKDEGEKLRVDKYETEERLKEADELLESTKMRLASAMEELKRKDEQLLLNIFMAKCEISEYKLKLDDLACDMPNSPSLESDTNTVPADLSSPKNQAILAAIKRSFRAMSGAFAQKPKYSALPAVPEYSSALLQQSFSTPPAAPGEYQDQEIFAYESNSESSATSADGSNPSSASS